MIFFSFNSFSGICLGLECTVSFPPPRCQSFICIDCGLLFQKVSLNITFKYQLFCLSFSGAPVTGLYFNLINVWQGVTNCGFNGQIESSFGISLVVYGLPWSMGSDSKESACNAGDPCSIPDSERAPGEGNGNTLQYCCWRIPWTEEPGQLQFIGSQRVRHNLATEQQRKNYLDNSEDQEEEFFTHRAIDPTWIIFNKLPFLSTYYILCAFLFSHHHSILFVCFCMFWLHWHARSSLTRIRSMLPVVEAQILSHRTAREVPAQLFEAASQRSEATGPESHSQQVGNL